MRSILITAGVLVTLIALFVTFLLTQKASTPIVKRTPRANATLPAPHDGGSSGLGGGEGGWVQRFDPKSGELMSELRAEHYDSPVDNVVHVIKPESRFYAKDGQVLTLHAKTGDITLAQSARPAAGLSGLEGQPPSKGTLYDVTLGLLESPDDETPVLVATLPVVQFDNDTLRLNTVPINLNGQTIAGDRVPVTVRGRDYDFDGEGLTVRYNQRDGRLERLEVAHGRRLLVKNPQAFGEKGGFVDAGPLSDDGRPVELASADPEAARRMSAEERARRLQRRAAADRRANRGAATRAATKPASTRPRELFAYVATFHEAVKLTEAGEPVGLADTMAVTFASKNDQSPATQPVADAAAAIAPATQPDAVSAPATAPTRRPRRVAATRAVTTPTTQSASAAPATMPAVASPTTAPTGPVEITWSGKLVVVPLKLAESNLRSTRDRIVEFAGRPVTLHRQGSTVIAAKITAALEGDRLRAAPDAFTPQVTLSDPNGTTLTTESIEADGDDANLYGNSRAEIAIDKPDAPATRPGTQRATPQRLVATWNNFAALRLTTQGPNKRGIERAVFRGNVHVKHPQLDMTSDNLALGFTPAAAGRQPQVSAVRADGAVKASLMSTDGKPESLAAETLDLATASDGAGGMAVRSMHAHGNVVASDPKQVLKTDDLSVTPSATPAGIKPGGPVTMEVDHLTAVGQVHFATDDGSVAEADRLSVDRENGVQWATLVGTPARVTDPQMTAIGNTLRVSADDGGRAHIDGPGSLHAVQPGEQKKSGQPIDVAWSQSMDYDAAANKASVAGDVTVVTRAADGTKSTAKGATLDLVLTDAPATQPSGKPSGVNFGGGANKAVRSFTLRGANGGNVEVSSVLNAANDANRIVRRTYMEAPMVTVDTNPDGTPGAVNVPVAGRMLYENSAAPAASSPAGGNGTVALEWKKSMTYDPAKQQAVLDGDVQVVRQSVGQPAVTLSAPRVVADVSGAAAPGGAQLKKISAESATLTTPQVTLNAATAVYDPAADRVIATGTPREPVKWFDEKGLSKGSFGEVWWNLKTNQPEKLVDVTVEMNR